MDSQDIEHKTWSNKGSIVELVPSADLECRSFGIQLDKGPIIWRSARFLRLDQVQIPQPELQEGTHNVEQAIKTIFYL